MMTNVAAGQDASQFRVIVEDHGNNAPAFGAFRKECLFLLDFFPCPFGKFGYGVMEQHGIEDFLHAVPIVL